MKIAELWIEIDTRLDKFNKGMTDAEKAMVRVGKKFEAVGKKMTMMMTLPILAVGAAAVKMGADFEQSMMNAASVSGATGEELKRMEAIARDMGETTVFSAKQAADAMYFMACLKPDEYIITDDYRVEKIGKFKGSSVVGKNGIPQKVLKHTHRPCTEGEVLKIKPSLQLPFSVTANHPILAIKSKPCRPYQKAGKSDSPKLCKPNCNSHLRKNCTKIYYKNYKPEWIEAGKLEQGDILLIPRIKKSQKISIDWSKWGFKAKYLKGNGEKNLPVRLNEDLAYFLGLMTGDGWADKERIGCIFNKKKDIKSKKWFVNYLKKLGYSTQERKIPGAIQITSWSQPLAKLIKEWINCGAQNKQIPSAIFKSEESIILSYLRGLIDSDGYFNKEKSVIGISTISPHIAFTINYLAAKVKIAFSLGKVSAKKAKKMPSGSISDLKELYTISTTNPDYIEKIFGIRPEKELKYQKHWIDEDYVYLPIYRIEKEKYEGFVYNLETEDNTYSTGVIVHNSAGWKVDDMGKAIKPTLDLAAATQSDLAFTTDTVVASLNQFQLGSEGAERLTNVFAAAIGNSQATMEKLSISMRYVGPVFHSMGKSVEEATSVLMGLYNAGYDASMAGTALRMGMVKLLKPTKETSEALKRLGLTFENVNPTTMKMADIIDVLGKRGAKTKDIIEIFGVRAGPAFAALIAQGGDALRKYEKGITGTDAAARMAEMQINTLKGSFKLLTSALTESAIQIFKLLGPGIKDLVDNKLKPAVLWFNKLSEVTKKEILIIAGLTAAMGPLLMIFGKMLVVIPRINVALATMNLSLGAVAIAVTAAYTAYKGLLWVRDRWEGKASEAQQSRDKELKSWQDLSEAIGGFTDFLIKAEKAEILTVKKRREIWAKYKGDFIAGLKAISEGKEGEGLKKFLEELAGKHVEAATGAETQEEKLVELTKSIDETTKAVINAVYASDKLIPSLEDMGGVIKDLPPDMSKFGKTSKDIFNNLIPVLGKVKKSTSDIGDEFGLLPASFFDSGEKILTTNDAIAAGLIKTGEGIKITWKDVAKDMADYWSNAMAQMVKEGINLPDILNIGWQTMAVGAGSAVSKVISAVGGLGQLAGPLGALAGSIAGTAISAIGSILGIKSAAQKAAEAAAKAAKDLNFWINNIMKATSKYGDISEETAKKIQEADKSMEGFAAVSKYFADIIKDVGVTQDNVNTLWDRAVGIIENWHQGHLTAAEAAKAAGESFTLLLEGTRKLGQEGSEAMINFILKTRELGLEVSEVTEYVVSQLDRIPDALESILAPADRAGGSLDFLKEKLAEQNEELKKLEEGMAAYEALEGEIAKTEQSIIDLTDKLEKQNEALAEIEERGAERYRDLTLDINETELSILKLNETLDEQTARLSELGEEGIEKYKGLEEEINNTRLSIGELKNALAEQMQELAGLEEGTDEYIRLEDEINDTALAIDSATQTLREQIEELKGLEEGTEEYIRLKDEIKNTENAIADVNKLLDEQLDDLIKLDAGVSMYDVMAENIANTEAEIAAANTTLSEQIANLKELEKGTDEYNLLRGQIIDTRQSIIDLNAKLDEQNTLFDAVEKDRDLYADLTAAIAETGNAIEGANILLGQQIFQLGELEYGTQAYKDLKKEIEETKNEINTTTEAYGLAKDELERMGVIALATFNSMIASGVSWNDAVEKMQGPLSTLRDQYNALGIEGNEALDKLFGVVGVVEANEDLFDAIEANQTILEALGNTGFMTGEILNGFATDAIENYEDLKDKFGNSDDALRAMGPTLQSLKDYADAYNIELDEGTKALIDQATELGVVKEKQESVQDVAKQGFGDMKLILTDIKDVLQGIGDKLKGSGIHQALKDIDAVSKTTWGNMKTDVGLAVDKVGGLGTKFSTVFDAAKSGSDSASGEIQRNFAGISVNVSNNFGSLDQSSRNTAETIQRNFKDINVDVGSNFVSLMDSAWETAQGVKSYFEGIQPSVDVSYNFPPGGFENFQAGGIAWTPQIAMVAEKEPEIIMPLSKYAELTPTIATQPPTIATQSLATATQPQGPVEINFNITGVLDALDVETVVIRKIMPILEHAYQDNVAGVTKSLKDELEKY